MTRPAGSDATVLSSLTARQLAGQRVIYSYPGLTPPASLLALIRDGAAAGVIFFGDNISSHAQIAAVIKTLETADADPSNPVRAPLLLMTDQEGGQVRRLSGAPVLSEKQIAGSAHPANEVEAAGSGAGENLKGVGMNVNLAPVLDVYRQAGNFIDQFGRSYSSHAHTASWLGADVIRAQQQVGVAAMTKSRTAPPSGPGSSWSWSAGRCTRPWIARIRPGCRRPWSAASCGPRSASPA